MADEILLTQEGYDKIVAEHEELVSVRRKEISEKLKEAISYGDLSENAEYDAAKNEQAELEERIFKLEDMIKKAKIIKEEEMSNDFVGVGSRVSVKDMDNGDEMDFTIVGSTEADPFAGKISNESLVGQHLIGTKDRNDCRNHCTGRNLALQNYEHQQIDRRERIKNEYRRSKNRAESGGCGSRYRGIFGRAIERTEKDSPRKIKNAAGSGQKPISGGKLERDRAQQGY